MSVMHAPRPRHATHSSTESRGQIIVLAALLMVLLVAMAGLAIDVSAAYMADRWQRSVADASALAGGQDLQIPNSRALPGAAEQNLARLHAMDVLVSELGATSQPSTAVGSPCLTSGGCPLPGTPYVVSIQTPSPSCVDCQPQRAIQVSVRQPSFGLTFARIFGQSRWTVTSTSVAGIVQAKEYGVVTLRAPKPRQNGTDANQDDLFITGGSVLNVANADVGVNTNMVYSGTNSLLRLDPGFVVDHYDVWQAWTAPPPGNQITSLIPDPGYPVPTRVASTSIYNNINQAQDTGSGCYGASGARAKVPLQYTRRDGTPVRNLPNANVICLKPGVYRFQVINSASANVILLEPGTYFLDAGLQNSSTLIGGYEGGQPGVALVLQEAKNQSGIPGQFTTNSSDLLALNMGDQFKNASGARATAADGPQGPVQTLGPHPLPMTLIVVPDPSCTVQTPPSAACDENHNKTLQLPGSGELYVAGVQYAPSDNVTVTGESQSTGILGQVISWTITFNSSFLNLEAAVFQTNGVLRLDPACSPAVNLCNP
jgi:hypothetical protein